MARRLDDAEITKRMASLFKKRGIDVRTGTTVEKMDVSKKGVRVELKGAKKGVIDVDLVLVGIGRKYHSEVVTENPSLGVKVAKRGEIVVEKGRFQGRPGRGRFVKRRGFGWRQLGKPWQP